MTEFKQDIEMNLLPETYRSRTLTDNTIGASLLESQLYNEGEMKVYLTLSLPFKTYQLFWVLVKWYGWYIKLPLIGKTRTNAIFGKTKQRVVSTGDTD